MYKSSTFMDPSSVQALAGSLNTTMGALEMGVLLSCMLFGAFVHQVCHYTRTYSQDYWYLKALVGGMTILDIGHTALLLRAFWYYSIELFGNFIDIGVVHWSLPGCVYFSAATVFATQAFFWYRFWKLTGKKIVSLSGLALGVGRAGLLLESASLGLSRFDTFASLRDNFGWGVGLALIVGAVEDLIIAAALSAALFRSSMVVPSTGKILHKLIMFTVSSGIATSLVSLLTLICFQTMSNLIWVALLAVLLKLFPNSVLASLNERAYLRPSDLTGLPSYESNSRVEPATGSRGSKLNLDGTELEKPSLSMRSP